MGRKTKYKLEQVAIRMVREAPLYSDTPIIRVEDAVKVVAEALRDYDREVFGVINIRSDGRPININIASIGTINASLASPKEILKSTILSNAADILLFHNHPGGRRNPSKQDIEMTDKMLLACKLMDVNVLDHIILFGGNVKEYYSFRENEILVFPENRYKTNVSELDFEQKNFGECSIEYVERRYRQEAETVRQEPEKKEKCPKQRGAKRLKEDCKGEIKRTEERVSVKRKIEKNKEKLDENKGRSKQERAVDREGR